MTESLRARLEEAERRAEYWRHCCARAENEVAALKAELDALRRGEPTGLEYRGG